MTNENQNERKCKNPAIRLAGVAALLLLPTLFFGCDDGNSDYTYLTAQKEAEITPDTNEKATDESDDWQDETVPREYKTFEEATTSADPIGRWSPFV